MRTSLLPLLLAVAAPLHAQTTHILTTMDMQFVPDTILAVQGDSLKIIFDTPDHTFTQVSPETWEQNGNLPAGLLNIGPGVDSTTIALDASGTIHYVCSPHASEGMKGIVDVALAIGIGALPTPQEECFYPNPTNGTLWMRGSTEGMMDIFILDALGQEVQRTQALSDRPIDVSGLEAGRYTIRVVDSAGRPVFVQEIVRE